MMYSATTTTTKDTTQSSSSAESVWQPAQLGLLRLAGQTYTGLSELKFGKTIALFDQILANKQQLDSTIDALNTTLYDHISNYEGSAKSGLVALKRRIFNRRQPRRSDIQLLRELELTELAQTTAQIWILHKSQQRLTKAAEAQFNTEIQAKRHYLQQMCTSETFQKGIQSASPALYSALDRYIKADVTKFRRKERKTELGAFQYLVRMTSKTSPFGHFGPIAPVILDREANQAIHHGPDQPHRHVVSEIRRVIIALIKVSLSKAPGIREYLPPQLNQSYRFEGNEIVFDKLRTQIDSTDAITVKVQRRGKRFPLLETVINQLEQKPFHSVNQLIQESGDQHPNLDIQHITTTIQKLIIGGFIMLEMPIASYEQQPLQALIAFLEQCSSQTAIDCSNTLRELDELCNRFAATAPDQRAQMQRQARQLIESLLIWRPLAAQDHNLLDQIFIEDVSYPELDTTIGAPILEQIMPDIAALLECGYQRDGIGLARSWLQDAFIEEYGENGTCDDMSQFAQKYQPIFQEFQELASNTHDQHPRMPRSNAIQARNRAYAAFMDNAIKRDPDEVVLQRSELTELAQTFGNQQAPTSVGLHIQLVAENQTALEQGDVYAVLNYTLPGFSRFMARYQHGFNQADRALLDTHVTKIAQTSVQADQIPVSIVSVLDHNAQAYAPLMPLQLVPADERSSEPLESQLHLRDLKLSHCAASDRLITTSTKHERELALLYLGSLHLTSLPSHHRFLAQLTPTVYHMEALRPREHAHLKPPKKLKRVTKEPRLRIGRLIVQRATWNVPRAEAPSLDQAQDWELFFAAYSWAKSHSIPGEVFMRVHRDYGPHTNIWTAHKPSAIDWENYFSVLLFKQAIDEHVVSFAFEEMLPTPQQQSMHIGEQPVISELQIEFTRGGQS